MMLKVWSKITKITPDAYQMSTYLHLLGLINVLWTSDLAASNFVEASNGCRKVAISILM